MVTPIAIFTVAYALIAFSKIPKSLIALMGAALMVLLGSLDSDHAFEHVDLNVVLLLACMMLLADITGRTGIFEWGAIKSAQLVRGNGFAILLLLCLITAVASAFLDNVTTVVLMVPVTISICRALNLDPVRFLVAEIFASNIGGAATLIGDPPNMIIGSEAGISFADFAVQLTPVILIELIVLAGILWVLMAKSSVVSDDRRTHIMSLDPAHAITDVPLLKKSTGVLAFTIIGFMTHGLIHVEPAFIAMAGAAALMLIGRIDPAEAFKSVHWTTLFFFIGLFMMVGGLIENGVLVKIQEWLISITGDDLNTLAIVLLWFSGVVSAIVDNIPYAATMVPIIMEIAHDDPATGISVLWWSLSLGANLGGNFTVIGAAANVLVSGAAKAEGHPISFMYFLKYGVIVSSATLAVASGYLWLRYL